ncbi:MAG TPA: amino acid adenylation domain-containing protein [Actinomycetes bacterium]|nr:amino acid adenylation domain-containing protein [Actinomycetes bacterium]
MSVVAEERESAFPASFAQERVWIAGNQRERGSPLHTLVGLVPLPFEIGASEVEAALAEVAQRHETLRTSLRVDAGALTQVIHPAVPVQLRHLDLSGLPPAARERRLEELRAAEARTPLAPDRAPLWRALLARFAPAEHRLLFVAHHSIFDAASYVNLWAEISELLRAGRERRPPRLPELPIQYADYAVWQREQLGGAALERHRAFWRERLAGIAPIHGLPTDRPRPPRPGDAGEVGFPLDPAVMARVETLARRCGVTPFMVLLAAWAALLARLSGQADVVVGVLVDGRDLPELQPLIGMFVNPVVLRIDAGGDPTFAELLGRVRERALEAWEHQDTPFQKVVETLAPRREPGVPPLYQIGFNYLPRTGTPDSNGAAEDDLRLDLGRLQGRLEYRTDLFDAATARALTDRYLRLLAAAVSGPGERLSSFELLEADERRLLLEAWNRTTTGPRPAVTVRELVAAQSRRTPDATAVVCGDRRLTYAELGARAARLARHLRRAGAGPGALVGVRVGRVPELLVALLGVLEAGAAYLPLDPDLPEERLEFILGDAGTSLVLTDREVLEGLAGGGPGDRDPAPSTRPGDLAYVIYTSGSTGRPKGVEVEHRALVNFLLAMREQLGASQRDTWLALTSLSFDISALELLLPLVVGAKLVLASDPRDGPALERLIAEHGVTHVQATPSGWRVLLAAGFDRPGVTALVGGEALPLPLARQLRPRVRWLGNLYGPTETTVWSTIWPVPDDAEAIRIGRPIANTQVYVLDGGLRPVPVGVPGDLYIGGAGLARGYRARPRLTAERFLSNPFGPPGSRMYATGDRARWHADGQLEFLGRSDNQVKLRGYRVEPGEIEARLLDHPKVTQAAVVAHADPDGDPRLVAYVVAPAEGAAGAEELRRHLGRSLPGYMVPSAFVTLERLPLTPNGKLDRGALPAPERTAGPRDRYVPPRGDAQELVASIFAELLGLDRVSASDDFFDLGGHSLLALRAVARLSAAVEAEVPIHALFRQPTVAGLAGAVEALLVTELDQLSDEEAERLLAGGGPGGSRARPYPWDQDAHAEPSVSPPVDQDRR